MNSRLLDFVRSEGLGLGVVGLTIAGVAVVIVGVTRGWVFPPVSYADVGSLIVATVAVTSLYIAWRELVRKTEANVTVDYEFEYPDEDGVEERLVLKVINSGANVVTPVNAWYGMVRRMGDDYHFTNTRQSVFSEDVLQPGDTARVEIGDDVVLMELTRVNIRDWKGNGVSLEEFEIESVNRVHLADLESDIQVKIQKVFDTVMDISHQFGVRISSEELQTSDVTDLYEEYNLDGELVVKTVDDLL